MVRPESAKITVLGAGSWGTALTKHLADSGHTVKLWTRRSELAASIQKKRENTQYLPKYSLSENVLVTSDLEEALLDAHWVLSVIPSQFTRRLLQSVNIYLTNHVPVICASKGIELNSLQLMSEIFQDELPNNPLIFLGGPSFSKEVAAHMPTAVVLGCIDNNLAKEAQYLLSTDWLRCYITHDVVGLEVGGALKNVMAIACGCTDGLGLGANTRAALMTRGLAEMTRLACKMGAEPQTLAGLGGMGDLVLTCTGDLSRNRRVGLGLGQGKKLPQILSEMGQVAEGVETCSSARSLSQKLGVEMPITEQIWQILHHDKPVQSAVLDLMRRNLKHEQN